MYNWLVSRIYFKSYSFPDFNGSILKLQIQLLDPPHSNSTFTFKKEKKIM